MKLQFSKEVRRSLLVGSAVIPIVVLALIFQNCSRAQIATTAALVEPVVNAKSMKGPCQDSSILGVWFSMWSPSGDVFAFTPDCRGSSSHCGSEFSYSKTGEGLTGKLSLRVSKTKSMPGCPTVGDHVCEYEISVLEKRMHFRCNNTQWAEFDMFSPVDGGVVQSPPPTKPAADSPVQLAVVPPEPPPASPQIAANPPPVPPTPPPIAAKVAAKVIAKAPPARVVRGRNVATVAPPAPQPQLVEAPEPTPVRAPAAVSPASAGKRIYVSTSPYSGNLGGIAGADLKCNSDPNRPAGVTRAKALLSDGFNRVACANPQCDEGVEGQADWPLRPGTAYRDVEGNLIGTTNSYGIFSGQMSVTAALSSVRVWTGLRNDWTSSNEHCSSWGQGSRVSGTFGMPTGGNFAAGAGSKLCEGSGFRLICVEQ